MSELLKKISLKMMSFPNSFILVIFLLFNSLSRLVLLGFALYEGQIDFDILELLQTILLGVFSDIITSFYFMIPFTCLGLFAGQKARQNKTVKFLVHFFYFSMCLALCFLVVSEFTFWLEFNTRYNFIAVDYLVYTHEVIGNIRESYPIFIILPTILIVGSIIYYKIRPIIKTRLAENISFKIRLTWFCTIILGAALSFSFYEPKITDVHDDNYLSEISKNGLYNLFSAFRHNSIDYDIFYKTRDEKTNLKDLFKYIKENNKAINPNLLEREIQAKGPKNNYNVIVIPMESFGTEFLSQIHGDTPLTPVMLDLIKQGAYFNNLYATGTRTIRGLEAITLSIPPLPGQSIVRRENNDDLFSIGSILKQEDYDLKFIYGGHGYFDNMNEFFSKNGFKTWDRNNIPEKEVSFANIWGISDEDLYVQVIKQADESYSQNKKFFLMVMNTSNHRPYTYPEGKIDIPQKAGRHGGVKYADFALGELIKMAKTKPWFDNTIFVITADHCAGSAGKTALPPHKYHIPLVIYAPKIIKPQVISKMSSQIDIAPTILGLLNISYNSRFFGNDIFSKTYKNAFISTFQKLGYIEKKKLVVLSPGKIEKTYKILKDEKLEEIESNKAITNRAINYYQSAYEIYQSGMLKANAETN